MKQNLTSIIFSIIVTAVCASVPFTVQAAIADKASSNTSLNRGLVGYWTFDGKDMANGVALDKSGNGHTGLIYNIATSTFYGEGKIGQGLKFDGSNDFIEIGQTSLTNNMTAMSASFWLNTSSFASCGSGNGAIIEKQYFTHGWLLGCINTGYLAMTVYTTGGNGGMTVRTSVPITTNKWKHVVFSWDGDLNGAGAKFYIDGVDSTNLTQAGTGSRINDSSVPLHIARDVYDGQFYGGLMDDVRLYNRALTAAEAKQLYALGGSKQAVSSKVTNTSCSSGLSCGLVGYWTFDGKDMANGVALDKSGNGNKGNLTNIATSTFYTDGKIGQAGKFDGVDDLINSGAGASLNNLSSLSVSFWLKPQVLATQQAIVSKADNASGGHGWAILTDSSVSSRLSFEVFGFGPDLELISASGALVANQWAHYTVTWDGSTTATNAHIYKNGVEVSYSVATNGVVIGNTDEGRPVLFGRDSGWGSAFLNGTLDDVRIYNRALSAAEVKQLYAIGVTKQAVSSKVTNTSCSSGLSCGLVGYWTFDGKDMANGVALDKSGNGNKGNLTNIATSTFYTDGKIGQAGKFDGVDDFAAVHPVANDIGSGSVTVSAWFKLASSHTSSLANAYTIFSLADSASGNDIRLCFAMTSASPICSPTTSGVSGGKLCLIGYTGAVDKAACTSQSSWTGGVWYHVVALIDTNGGGEKLYVNAALAGSDANTTRGSPQSTLACVSTDVVGSNCSSNDLFSFKGSIDDVRIYNRALSATEVQQLYNAGR